LGLSHLKSPLGLCLIPLLLLACTKSDARTNTTAVRVVARQDSVSEPVAVQKLVVASVGPTLRLDSTISEPRLDNVGGVFTVHLPADMARVLNDSLPGFTPFPQTNYSSSLRAMHATPLSIVLGDFNGDSAQDVAMLGESDSTPALILVLARSAKMPEPRLVWVMRPAPHTSGGLPTYYLERVGPQTLTYPDNPKIKLELRTDGIYAFNESVSTVYYLKDGQVRTFSMAGD
jgi:hypothetical protein